MSNSKYFWPMLSVILVLLNMCSIGIADDSGPLDIDADDPARLELKTERVIVFKDGYCLVVKQGKATADENGVVFTDEVPDSAILGSFWAVPENGTIKAMVAGWEETESETQREVNCLTTVEVIKANLGKACSFQIGSEKFSGTILKVLSPDDLPNDPSNGRPIPGVAHVFSSHSSSQLTAENPSAVTVSRVTGDYFVLRTATGDMMVATSNVRHLTIEEMASTLPQTVSRKSRHKRISIKFSEPKSDVKINLMYFRPDVRWIPTYRVNLTEEKYAGQPRKKDGGAADEVKSAEIFMQGEILNEAEDFVDVPFHVVVGVPNFRFRSIPSPMTLESSMRQSLAQAAPNIMGNGSIQLSNALYTQRSSEFRSNRAAGNADRAEVDFPTELTSTGTNDLFVYKLDPMSLKKGERALVPILRTTVPYRNIYTWDIHLTHAETYAASAAESPSPLLLSENKIWRQVELINDTDIPWTTGAAMFVDGVQPLAQELLTYTSPGGICRVPVTVSVDLRGKVEDRETKRELKALRWRGHDYALINGKIDVELANNKTEPVRVEVRLKFGGKAKTATLDGEVTLRPYNAQDWVNSRGDAVNNRSHVKWTGTVEPGECFEPAVDYQFYVRY